MFGTDERALQAVNAKFHHLLQRSVLVLTVQHSCNRTRMCVAMG
jgi:hypothetical protein